MPLDLLLMRHAKSSWADPGGADHDRPLKPRGWRDAAHMARALAGRGLGPSHIVCSSARRARETAAAVNEALGGAIPVVVDAALYLAPPEALWARVRATPDAPSPLLLVAHNPGLEYLVARITGRAEPFPTAAVAWVRLPAAAWSGLGPPQAQPIAGLWRPSDAPGAGPREPPALP